MGDAGPRLANVWEAPPKSGRGGASCFGDEITAGKGRGEGAPAPPQLAAQPPPIRAGPWCGVYVSIPTARLQPGDGEQEPGTTGVQAGGQCFASG